MVNLKNHFLKKTQNEEDFKESSKEALKLIAKGDEEFIRKSICAIRDIIKDESVDSKPKYYLLQLINLGCQLKAKVFYEVLGDKLLERLYLLACFDKTNPSVEERGLNLFKEINPKSNETYSLKFYLLLIELFGYWGSDGFASSFDDFYSKYTVLTKAGIDFPNQPKHLYIYTDLIKNTRKEENSKQVDRGSAKQYPKPQKALAKNKDVKRILEELKNIRVLIQDHFDNNEEATFMFDDYFQLIREHLNHLEQLPVDAQADREYQTSKKYLDVYNRHKYDYDGVKKLLHHADENEDSAPKNQKAPEHTENSGKDTSIEGKKELPRKKKNDDTNQQVSINNVEGTKPYKPNYANSPHNTHLSANAKAEHKPENQNDDILLEFLTTERNHLYKKIKDLERMLTDAEANSERYQKKFHEQELINKRLESKLKLLETESQHYKKSVESYIRELSLKIKTEEIKSKPTKLSLRSHDYRPGTSALGFKQQFDFDIRHESITDKPISRARQGFQFASMGNGDRNDLFKSELRVNQFNKLNTNIGITDDLKMNKADRDPNFTNYSQIYTTVNENPYQRSNIADMRSRMNVTNDFLYDFNKNVDKILNREPTLIYHSAYDALKPATDYLLESNPASTSNNYLHSRNTIERNNNFDNDKNNTATTTGRRKNALAALVGQYNIGKDDRKSINKGSKHNNHKETSKMQVTSSAKQGKQPNGILKHKLG